MLVLSRKKSEVVRIGDHIAIMVVEIRGDKVRLGIEAPKEMPVHRSEIYDSIQTGAGPVSSLATGDGLGVDESKVIAHFCHLASDLIDQVIRAEGFVGPVCRERLVMAGEKLARARQALDKGSE